MKNKKSKIYQHDIKTLSIDQLDSLANDIRSFLISNISKTGGHIGTNLGIVELTVAAHRVFDLSTDKVIFDTGHQGYTHKILTGREDLFPSLNSKGGMSRFLTRHESKYDIIDASHAGTSISIATGLAISFKNKGLNNYVVAVIGDGSMVEGMAFEGLNFSTSTDLNLVIVLNDNGMAIAPNVGGMLNLTSGEDWQTKSKAYFEGLGLKYKAVSDGHDIAKLVDTLSKTKKGKGPFLVHVKTEKGKGLPTAGTHPYKMHFSVPFDPKTGKGASPTVAGKSFASVGAETIESLLKEDSNIFVITPGTPYASGLDSLLVNYPENVIDVGMAEQHAVGMACGLALDGRKPIVCFQTTFMQRAFDQILHDACYMNLPITFLGVRSGFSGYDSATHHGIYDIPYLRSFPNLQLVYPANSIDMQNTLIKRLQAPKGPMVILHPYEPITEPEPEIDLITDNGVSLILEGGDGMILCLGNRLKEAMELQSLLHNQLQKLFGLAVIRQIKPFPQKQMLVLLSKNDKVITTEESTLPGGFGSLVCEFVNDSKLNVSVLRTGVEDKFVSPGDKTECAEESGISPSQLLQKTIDFWPALKEKG